MQQRFPACTLLLALIHAIDWVKTRTLLLLRTQARAVVDELRDLAHEPGAGHTAAQDVQRVFATDLERNAPFMPYATYLARGWPMATGTIAGTCRHLVVVSMGGQI